MLTLFEKILGRRRVLIKENERALHLYKGELRGILGPGEYNLAARKNRLEIERHDLTRGNFASAYEKPLFDKLPDVAAKHLTVFRTTGTEVAVIERDGRLHTVLGPDAKLILWTAAGP